MKKQAKRQKKAQWASGERQETRKDRGEERRGEEKNTRALSLSLSLSVHVSEKHHLTVVVFLCLFTSNTVAPCVERQRVSGIIVLRTRIDLCDLI